MEKKKILLVDDELFACLVADELRNDNFEVIFVRDGEEALEQVRKNYFDIVLMDMQMPIMDGIEAIKEIRELAGYEYEKVPIIGMSGLLGAHKEFVKVGANDSIGKPFQMKELIGKINSLLVKKQIEKTPLAG
jgi:two-component system, sensor histidine kinase